MRVPGCQRTTRDAGLICSTSSSGRSGGSETLYISLKCMSSKPAVCCSRWITRTGMRRLPRHCRSGLRSELDDRRIEIDLAVHVHLHERRRDEGLADRAGAEVRVGGHRRLAIAIGEADAAGPFDAPTCAPARCRRRARRCRSAPLHRGPEIVDASSARDRCQASARWRRHRPAEQRQRKWGVGSRE